MAYRGDGQPVYSWHCSGHVAPWGWDVQQCPYCKPLAQLPKLVKKYTRRGGRITMKINKKSLMFAPIAALTLATGAMTMAPPADAAGKNQNVQVGAKFRNAENTLHCETPYIPADSGMVATPGCYQGVQPWEIIWPMAKVSADGGNPTGSVVFKFYGTQDCTGAVLEKQTGKLRVVGHNTTRADGPVKANMDEGTYFYHAQYKPDSAAKKNGIRGSGVGMVGLCSKLQVWAQYPPNDFN